MSVTGVQVTCPLCQGQFSVKDIEAHVNVCVKREKEIKDKEGLKESNKDKKSPKASKLEDRKKQKSFFSLFGKDKEKKDKDNNNNNSPGTSPPQNPTATNGGPYSALPIEDAAEQRAREQQRQQHTHQPQTHNEHAQTTEPQWGVRPLQSSGSNSGRSGFSRVAPSSVVTSRQNMPTHHYDYDEAFAIFVSTQYDCLTLPHALLVHVISFLPLRGQCQCTKVCRAFYILANVAIEPPTRKDVVEFLKKKSPLSKQLIEQYEQEMILSGRQWTGSPFTRGLPNNATSGQTPNPQLTLYSGIFAPPTASTMASPRTPAPTSPNPSSTPSSNNNASTMYSGVFSPGSPAPASQRAVSPPPHAQNQNGEDHYTPAPSGNTTSTDSRRVGLSASDSAARSAPQHQYGPTSVSSMRLVQSSPALPVAANSQPAPRPPAPELLPAATRSMPTRLQAGALSASTGSLKDTIIPAPAEHMQSLVGWCGAISRDGAESKLTKFPHGTFLIRWSVNTNCFVLSYKSGSEVIHISGLEPKNGKICVTKSNGEVTLFEDLLGYVHAMVRHGLIIQPIELEPPPADHTIYESGLVLA